MLLRMTIHAVLLLSVAAVPAQSTAAATAGGPVAAADAHASAKERLRGMQGAFREARERGDWAACLGLARQIKELLNGSPRSLLEVARADVHTGDTAGALDELSTYARMGQASEVVEKLADFAPLRQRAEFAAIASNLVVNRQPVEHAAVAFRIPDAKLLPEDIDFDPRSRRFYFSSVLQHRIVSTTGDGVLAEFARAPDGWPMLALKIDTKRNLLWATEVALDGFDGIAKPDQGRSAVLCYDLKTGKLLRRIEGPKAGALGDMTLTAEGDVIVADGSQGGIYRLRSSGGELERLDQGDFISPQTIAMAQDGSHAYVPDYVRGFGLLDLRTKQVQWISAEGQFALDGVDGLYRVGRRLIAVQNGTSPERVVMFSVNENGVKENGVKESGVKIVAQEIIERATPTLGDPTHGVVVGDSLYYIANSGWDSLGDNGVVKDGATLTNAVVMKWKISQP